MDTKDLPGRLNKIKISEEHKALFEEYVSNQRGDYLIYVLFDIFGVDDSLKLFDIMSGKTIKFPKRKDIERWYLYVRVYHFLKVKGLDDKTVAEASNHFGKKTNSIIRIYHKVDETLKSTLKEHLSEDEEDNEDE